MDKHKPSDEMIKDLDNILSRLNAMEIVASDDYQKSSIKIMRALVDGQMHSINEFQHLKKGMDLLMLQLFDVHGVFNDEFAAARETVASGLAVSIRPGSGIEVVDAAGYPLERKGSEVSFRPGDLFAGQERRIWLTLRAPTSAEGEFPLGRFAVSYREPFLNAMEVSLFGLMWRGSWRLVPTRTNSVALFPGRKTR